MTDGASKLFTRPCKLMFVLLCTAPFLRIGVWREWREPVAGPTEHSPLPQLNVGQNRHRNRMGQHRLGDAGQRRESTRKISA
jgi:hypothetical protein